MISKELERTKIWQEFIAEMQSAKDSDIVPDLYKGRFELVVNNKPTVYKRITNGKI